MTLCRDVCLPDEFIWRMKRVLICLFLMIFCRHFLNAQEIWSLDSCIRFAYQKNISIQRSALTLGLAQANTKASLGALFPSLNGQATHGYNWGQRIDPFTNEFASQRVRSNNLGLSTSVNLFNGFQLQNTYKQSLIDEE